MAQSKRESRGRSAGQSTAVDERLSRTPSRRDGDRDLPSQGLHGHINTFRCEVEMMLAVKEMESLITGGTVSDRLREALRKGMNADPQWRRALAMAREKLKKLDEVAAEGESDWRIVLRAVGSSRKVPAPQTESAEKGQAFQADSRPARRGRRVSSDHRLISSQAA